jgi:hypothetical protein
VKHPFEENQFSSFKAYTVETTRDRKKCSGGKILLIKRNKSKKRRDKWWGKV